MDLMGLLVDDGILIAAGLYVVGMFLKKTPFIPDWLIPYILTVIGVLAAGLSIKDGFVLQNILQGIFAAGAAVLTNQLKIQAAGQEAGDAFSYRIEKMENRPMDNVETDTDEEDQNGKGGT